MSDPACTVPWLESLVDALARDEQAVLVVVASTQGSAPRETGAAMVVTMTGCVGSVGGGHLEFEATKIARDALATQTPGTWTVRFPLAARLGQCCGGVAMLAFSSIDRRARARSRRRTGRPATAALSIEPRCHADRENHDDGRETCPSR